MLYSKLKKKNIVWQNYPFCEQGLEFLIIHGAYNRYVVEPDLKMRTWAGGIEILNEHSAILEEQKHQSTFSNCTCLVI